MIETFKNAFKIKEIRTKILLTIMLVFIYRLGCYIPVPGISTAGIQEVFGSFDMLGIMSAITGGALSNGALFAIGISPYITSSIIMQLLTVAIPKLERLSKQGDEGKKKITKITRYVTIILAIINALGIIFTFNSKGGLNFQMLGSWGTKENMEVWTIIIATAFLVTGSVITMWIGERITEYGISNGISMLIFVGILSSAATAIVAAINTVIKGGAAATSSAFTLLGFLLMVVFIFALIVTVDGAERKVKVQYAKQIKGNKMYGGQSTFIPIRVNASGVLPLIFAYSLVSFPSLILGTFWPEWSFTLWVNRYMGAGTWPYVVILSLLILGFAYFYSQVQFNPVEISKNIQGNGGFIPGIRPGRETAEYLAKIVNRITLFGAIFLAFIAFVPSLIFTFIGANNLGLLNAFSATGMLIVVSVGLEFFKQLDNQILMRHYKGFLK